MPTAQGRRRILPAILTLLLLLASVPALASQAGVADGDPTTTERIGPVDPVDFAVAVSMARFADEAAEVVVLSRDDNFADSLAGAPLTGVGPLLYTQTEALPAATAAEIRRVLGAGGLVYILGGTAAVSGPVADALTADGHEVRRLAGESRVETALAVAAEARRLNPDGETVAVARAFGVAGNPTAAWADSVSAAAWAARDGVPLVVSPTDGLPQAVSAFLAADGPSETVILGGEAALSSDVADAVPNPRRVSGLSRSDTAAVIATELLGASATGDREAVVFNAFAELGWTRGLAVAGLAGERDAPLLAVNVAGVPPATAGLVSTVSDPEVDLLVAGPAVEVGAQLVAELDELDGGPPAPPRPEPGAHRLIAEDMTTQSSSMERLDVGRTGALVTFSSSSNDLGEEDFGGPNSPGTADTFVYDVVSERLLDISSGGTTGAEQLGRPTGQAVAGDRLVLWNGQGSTDGIVLWDHFTGRSERVLTFETDSAGTIVDPSISGDGSWLAYDVDGQLFLRPVSDRGPGTPLAVALDGQQDLAINSHEISADGGIVVAATIDLQGGAPQQAVLARPGSAPVLISRGVDGQPADNGVDEVRLSGDGSTVVFTSRSTNLAEDADGGVHAYAVDVATGSLRMLDRRPDGTPSFGVLSVNDIISITDDGATATFISDDAAFFGTAQNPGARGVVAADLATGQTQLIFDPRFRADFVSVLGAELSGDGRRLATIMGGSSLRSNELYLTDLP